MTMAMLDVASEGFANTVVILVVIGIPVLIGGIAAAIAFAVSAAKKKKQNPPPEHPETHDE